MTLTTQDILNKIDSAPQWGIVLGSGLQSLVDLVENPTTIPYTDIEGFPSASVQGHAGQLILGTLFGIPVAMMAGRIHYYEGGSMDNVRFPIRFLYDLGARSLVLTNAAGGVNTDYRPGELMLIRDHINFSGVNPLRGPNDDAYGPRFPDQTEVYDREYGDRFRNVAKQQGVTLHEGVYMWFSGPTYETPAEVRMARVLGADAVGMSTVPEAMIANHAGMRILGVSMITNAAAGVIDEKLSHEDVLDTGSEAADNLKNILADFIRESNNARR